MNLGSVTGAITAYLKWFDAVAALAAIEKYQIERAALVPTMLINLSHCPEREKYDTSSLKIITAGSAPLSEEIRLEFQRLYDCRVADGYGQSEASCVVAAYQDDEPVVPGSCGRALPGVTVSVMDDTGRQLPPGETGEICTQGDLVMQGYWGDERATRETIVDDWLHSGDVGHLDENGYLFITDRKKDLIIKGAENISPREIEVAIYGHSAVAECAVFGVPDTKYQEEIAAAIVLKPDQAASAEEISQHVLKYVTKFKKPAFIEFRDSLPKNSNNKILKRTLREQFAARIGQE
jgi:long-chain acyl-CoA synthetase